MTAKPCPHCPEGRPIHFSGKTSRGACLPCYRAKNKIDMAARRRKQKQKLLDTDNVPADRKVCSKCFHTKRLSEFSRRKNSEVGKLNKICDTCLTLVYASKSRFRGAGFTPNWWRARAYSCNAAGRASLAAARNVPRSEVALADLDYVCKPQELVQLYEQQGGACSYCRVELEADNTSVDHAHPRSSGGAHSLSNLRLTCEECNHLKHTKNEAEFLEFLQAYSQRDFRK